MRTRASTIAALALLLSLGATSCFISIDESLYKSQQGPVDSDAGPDVVQTDSNGSDGSDADALIQPDTSPPEEGGADAEPDVQDDASDATADAQDADDPDAEDGDATVDGGDGGQPPLADCFDDTGCPPVGCELRQCTNGSCVAAGTMKQEVTTFELPAPLACQQTASRTCLVAARSYLAAMTTEGLVVFNTRNPRSVRTEAMSSTLDASYTSLVRSGERLWAASESDGDTTKLAWLALPTDGRSPLPAPSLTTVALPPVAAHLPAPNDAILLYTMNPLGFARWMPTLPQQLEVFPALGSTEPYARAYSGGRVLMQDIVSDSGDPPVYTSRFSLQSQVITTASSNSGATDMAAAASGNASFGSFAYSRKGAIAWLIGTHDASSGQWTDLRVYWLVNGSAADIDPQEAIFETFPTQPAYPEGPITFSSDDTVAAAVISGGISPSPAVVFVRNGLTGPKLLKRIPVSVSGARSIAGDSGFAYHVSGTSVHVLAPNCNP